MKTIGGYDLKSLADQFGTPLYVYDMAKLQENYTNLASAFQKYYPGTRVHYSVKANSNLRLLEVFKSLGSGADCSSPNEVKLALRAGFNEGKILYTGNYESREDFASLDNLKIKVNLDDASSFGRMTSVFKPGIVSFRINPGIGRGGFEGITTGGTDAKFGVPYEMAYDAYKTALDTGITKFGIHMMTGSNNLEPYYFFEAVDKLMGIAGKIFPRLNVVPEYFDIGGGFGIPYDDDEGELNIDLTAKLITEVFTEKCEKFGFGQPALILEPGRYLTGNAGWLLSKVTGIKKSYKTFVGLDAGMNTLMRPALYGAKHRAYVYGKDKNELFVNLCGQVCENSDILARHIPFPVVSEGDLVVLSDAGAYGYSMSSVYNNRPRPAEVMIEAGKPELIRRRETFEDLLALYPDK